MTISPIFTYPCTLKSFPLSELDCDELCKSNLTVFIITIVCYITYIYPFLVMLLILVWNDWMHECWSYVFTGEFLAHMSAEDWTLVRKYLKTTPWSSECQTTCISCRWNHDVLFLVTIPAGRSYFSFSIRIWRSRPITLVRFKCHLWIWYIKQKHIFFINQPHYLNITYYIYTFIYYIFLYISTILLLSTHKLSRT